MFNGKGVKFVTPNKYLWALTHVLSKIRAQRFTAEVFRLKQLKIRQMIRGELCIHRNIRVFTEQIKNSRKYLNAGT